MPKRIRLIPTANFLVDSEVEEEYHKDRKAELEEWMNDPLVQEIRESLREITHRLAEKGLLKNRKRRSLHFL